MKTIIAVTFLGILTIAFAEECKLDSPASNFDSKKYFSIPLAYVTHSKNEPDTNVCRDYRSSVGSDGKAVTSFVLKDKSFPSGAEVECINTPISGINGQFTSACKLPGGNTYEVKSSILATDNENYAVLQRCGSSGPGNILVLQKNKDGVHQGVTNYFNQKGWSLNTWISRKNVSC